MGAVEHQAHCRRVVTAREGTLEFIAELTRLLATGESLESSIGSLRYDASDFKVWLPDAEENLMWQERLIEGAWSWDCFPNRVYFRPYL